MARAMTYPEKTSALTGATLLACSQVAVTIAGYLIHFVLARTLGPVPYGVFGVSYNVLYVFVLFVTAGIPAAVSHFVGADPRSATATMALALRLQAAISVFAAIVYGIGAGLIASTLSDPSLEPYLRASALAIPAHALLYLYLGYLGALQLFSRQASVTMVFAIVRLIIVALLAYFVGVLGAMAGLVLAPLSAMLLGAWLSPRPAAEPNASAPPIRALAVYALPLTMLNLALQLLLTVDLLLVKALLQDDVTTGYYTAASAIARVPYFVFAGVGLVLLPSVSRSLAQGLNDQAAHLIRQAIRAVIVCVAPAVGMTAAIGKQMVELLFSADFASAAKPLPVLVAGVSLIGLFYVLASVQAASDQEWCPVFAALAALGVGLGLGTWLVPACGSIGAALMVLGMGVMATGPTLVMVMWRFHVVFPIFTLGRSLVATTAAVFVVAPFPTGAMASVVALATGIVVYLLALVVLGELEPGDRALIMRSSVVASWRRLRTPPSEPQDDLPRS